MEPGSRGCRRRKERLEELDNRVQRAIPREVTKSVPARRIVVEDVGLPDDGARDAVPSFPHLLEAFIPAKCQPCMEVGEVAGFVCNLIDVVVESFVALNPVRRRVVFLVQGREQIFGCHPKFPPLPAPGRIVLEIGSPGFA